MSRGERNNEEQEFLKNLERMLAGDEVLPDEDASEEYGQNMEFARKLSELHEGPSTEFRERLKSRLLLKLTEREEAVREKATEPSWFSGLLSRLIPQSSAMRTAAVTVAVVLLAAGVMWRTGVFTPMAAEEQAEEAFVMDMDRSQEEEAMEEMIAAPPPIVPDGEKVEEAEAWDEGVSSAFGGAMRIETEISDSDVVTNLVGTRFTAIHGDKVILEIEFNNTTSETVTVSTPKVNIVDSAGLQVRTITTGDDTTELPASGKETLTMIITWDQEDDSGSQVPPGFYTFNIEPIMATRDTESINIHQPPVKVQVLEP